MPGAINTILTAFWRCVDTKVKRYRMLLSGCTNWCGMDAGWQYKGSFINGKSKPFREHDLGAMWECPFLTALQGASAAFGSNGGPQTLREDQLYMLCVSPYPHHLKDRLTNPCLYWLGHVRQELFQIAESDGQSWSLLTSLHCMQLYC